MSHAEMSAQPQCPGSIAFTLNGENLIAHRAGVLWWSQEATLVVADLHLEKGSSFARRGQFLPPYDSRATLARLESVIAELSPRRIIALGDSFHDREAAMRLGAQERNTLAKLQDGREWIWVSGNHDPIPPKDLGGHPCEEMTIGNLVFRHEPQIGALGEIAGHLHPCAKIRSRSRSIRRPCFVGDSDRMILPAFGTLTGGLNIRDSAYAELLRNTKNTLAYTLGDEQVHALAFVDIIPDVKRARAS
ncbi:MAG: phosphoesterase [Hyphomicrobiales bacterium]|nr:MAG: phosphoesterase [Hyphomicrobiales bacterium]